MSTDTSEQGLERLICTALAGDPCDPPGQPSDETPSNTRGGVGWLPGNWRDYDPAHCVDLAQLTAHGAVLRPRLPPRSHARNPLRSRSHEREGRGVPRTRGADGSGSLGLAVRRSVTDTFEETAMSVTSYHQNVERIGARLRGYHGFRNTAQRDPLIALRAHHPRVRGS